MNLEKIILTMFAAESIIFHPHDLNYLQKPIQKEVNRYEINKKEKITKEPFIKILYCENRRDPDWLNMEIYFEKLEFYKRQTAKIQNGEGWILIKSVIDITPPGEEKIKEMGYDATFRYGKNDRSLIIKFGKFPDLIINYKGEALFIKNKFQCYDPDTIQ